MKIIDVQRQLWGNYVFLRWNGYELQHQWDDPINTPSNWKELSKLERAEYKAGMREDQKEHRQRAKRILAFYNDKKNKNEDGSRKLSLEDIAKWQRNREYEQERVTFQEQMRWLDDASTMPNLEPWDES